MERLLAAVKKILPRSLFAALQPWYHYTLAVLAAVWYGFPSQHLRVIAVTGTKGKSTTVELIAALLSDAGYQVASLSTIQFRVGDEVRRNLFKMTMPGRFFVQRFLHEAKTARCQYAVVEMTSEGARQWRHHLVQLDALVFTNLAPEHIESHGSFDAYKACKLRLRDALAHSPKRGKYVVVNRDDAHAEDFLDVPDTVEKITYGLDDARPFNTNERGTLLTLRGVSIFTPLVGAFNLANILAAASVALREGVSLAQIKATLEKTDTIKGRVEKIDEGQKFTVVVDYAHTPESLTALYEAFSGRKICVLGNTGGGRDTWKRPLMGEIADTHCAHIILTDEDPYDEDPRRIVEEMRAAIHATPVEIVMDRRRAIRRALRKANAGDVVLITGKGTDPFIMRAHGAREPWSDEKVVREELRKLK